MLVGNVKELCLRIYVIVGTFCYCMAAVKKIRTMEAPISLDNPIKIYLGIVTTNGSGQPYDYDVVQPGVEIAIQKALNFFVWFDPSFTEKHLYDRCDVRNIATITPMYNMIMSWKDVSLPAMFLGPSCSSDFVAAAALASYYFMGPVISGGAMYRSNISSLPMGLRISVTTTTVWAPFLALCEKYNWTNINAIYYYANSSEPNQLSWVQMMEGLQDAVTAMGNETAMKVFTLRHDWSTDVTKNLQRAKSRASNNVRFLVASQHELDTIYWHQVHVIAGDHEMVRRYMITASELGMTKGNNAFVSVDFTRDTVISSALTGWSRGDSDDEKAKDAYRSLIVVSLKDRSADPWYKRFSHELQAWGVDNPDYQHKELLKNPNYYMLTYHDAILLGAIAVSSMDLAHRSSKNDGSVDQWNSLLRGIGYSWYDYGVRLTETLLVTTAGDICDDLDVYDMTDTDNGTFTKVVTYSGYPPITTTDYPRISTCAHDETTLTIFAEFDWPGENKLPPANEPECGYDGIRCLAVPDSDISIPLGSGIIFGCFALGIFVYFLNRYIRYYKTAWDWIIEPEELKVPWPTGETTKGVEDSIDNFKEPVQIVRMGATFGGLNILGTMSARVGFIGKKTVIVRHCHKKFVPQQRRQLKEVERVMKLTDESILKFLRASIQLYHVAVVYEHASRGCLIDVIHSSHPFQWIGRFTVMIDIIHGLQYLYSKGFPCHGRLTSNCLYMDIRFATKIADYGLPSFLEPSMVELWFAKKDPEFYRSLLWTAPEILRDYDHPTRNSHLMKKPVDVYSFGIILQELILWSRPYVLNIGLRPLDIVLFVQRGQNPDAGAHMRPQFPIHLDCDIRLRELAKHCWNEEQAERPAWNYIKEVKLGENVLDSLMTQMEELTGTLENSILLLVRKAETERRKYSEMLTFFVPRALAEHFDDPSRYLKSHAETYPLATVVCSDLLAPSIIRTRSTCNEVITCLNKLYACMDRTLESFKISKIWQLQDLSITVSGVPNYNDHHASEAARYALEAMKTIQEFIVPHKPDVRLQPRFGISSGTIMAGIMGTSIPRFFVNGDALSMALRMMYSVGNAPGIQISSSTKDSLERTDFVTERRGLIPYRDRQIMTFWLHGTRQSLQYRFPFGNSTRTMLFKRPSFLNFH